MKVGDLVRSDFSPYVGIVVEKLPAKSFGPGGPLCVRCKVLWANGSLGSMLDTSIEVLRESR